MSTNGYFYFADNGANCVLMLDNNLRDLGDWRLDALTLEDRVQGLSSDGRNLWLSVAGNIDQLILVDTSGDEVTVVRAFEAPPQGRGTIRDIAWDGLYLWAVNSGSTTYNIPPTLYKVSPTDGSILGEWVLPTSEPRALAHVPENGDAYGRGATPGIYYADVDADAVYCFNTAKMQFVYAFASPEPPRGVDYIFPVGMCFDGNNFWLVNSSSAGDHLFSLDYRGNVREMVELTQKTPGPICWTSMPILTLTGVTPNTGARGNTMTAKVIGTGFQSGSGLQVSFGEGITVDQMTHIDPFELEVTITIAEAAVFGYRNVTVTNPNGQSVTGENLFQVTEFDPLAGFLWLADGFSNILYKIRILDTAIVQTWDLLEVAPGGSPQGLAFDGTALWLSAGGTDDLIMRLDTADGSLSRLQSFTAPPNAEGVIREIAFDGAFMWAGNDVSDKIYKIDYSDGTVVDSITTPGVEIRGVAVAEGTLYCNDRTLDSVYAWNAQSSTWSAVFAIPTPPGGTTANRYSTGMTFDGVNFWIANSTFEFDYLFQVSPDGTLLRTYEVPGRGDAQPSALVYTQE